MLLDAAFGDSEGYAQVLVGRYEAGTLNIEATRWFSMPEELEDAEEYVNRHQDEDVYFTPALYDEGRQRRIEHTTVSRVVYMDADSCAPDKFRIRPTFSVETSPGKWQCYWLLDQDYPAKDVSDVAHRIAVGHKNDGCDPSSWILTKIMRVPGTMHRKTSTAHEVILRESTGEVFTLVELLAEYEDVVLPASVTVTARPMPDAADLPTPGEIASAMPDELTGIFLDGPPNVAHRSETRLRFQVELLRAGFTDEWVFAACQNANNLEKFTGEGRPMQLWKEVLKAHEYLAVEALPEVTDTDIPTPVVKTPTRLSFVTDAEREWLYENPGFIQEYTSWAKEKSPLSAVTYHRSLAVQVLSCVYGNWGYIVPKHGVMKLNYWVIVAGDTTATRKSTSRALMRSVLRQWQKVAGLKIDLGSDFTPQALTKTLGERDGLVSFIHRDEFQGFLHEIYTQNYMSGTAERMTELYDGTVHAVLRNTKELATEQEASVVFNFLAMGITKEIADRMTAANFRSGFLPRFTWAVAEPPEWKPEHEVVDQMDVEDEFVGTGDDPSVAHFISQFRLAQRAWAGENGTKHPKSIRFTDEALERWNDWKVSTKQYIRGLSNEDIMEPARDRMSYTVWKTAALLAIHERSKVIELAHLVRALEQAEWWFADMMMMADKVASSDFEAKVNKIEMMLATANGILPLSKVYGSKDFKQFRKGEVDECINSLEAQGRATRMIRENTPVLVLKREVTDGD